MGDIDRMRWEAVRELERLGFSWCNGAWKGTGDRAAPSAALLMAADALHGEITGQIEELAGATEASPEAETLEHLIDLAQAYEAVRPRD